MLSKEEMRRRFRACGLKMTQQRAAIYEALAGTTSHPTADDLYRQVRRQYPTISLNTVYYTLGMLRESGLACEVNYWHDRSRFDANMNPHHHVLCLGCRSIQDVMDEGLDGLAVAELDAAGFQVRGHRVEFHGYCAACCRRGLAGITVGRPSIGWERGVEGVASGGNKGRANDGLGGITGRRHHG